MAEQIITHGGSAHMDDLLSVGLVLALDEDVRTIARRNPTPEELRDPDVWVLDVGCSNDPTLLNFDHHQFPKGQRECCFSLLAKHFELVDELEHLGWYKALVTMDALGPQAAAKELDCPPMAIAALHGPVQRWILHEFSQRDSFSAHSEFSSMLRKIGRYLVGTASFRRERLALVRATAEWIDVQGEPMLLFLEDVADPGSFMFDFQEESERRATAVVTRSRRNEGWSMRRVDDDGPLDFRRIFEEPTIGFAHKSGFMAVTRGYCSRQELRRLLTIALGK
jgi:hypothetical protein